jgi:oxaloacetate decarboxylase beta subunit
MSIGDFIVNNLETFLNLTGVAQCQYENLLMIAVGALFIWIAIKHDFEPLLLVPIGMGIIVGNIPFVPGMEVGLYEEGSGNGEEPQTA